MKQKKKVAIWLHGGIGTGLFSQGYPLLDRIVKELAHDFDISVYSLTPPNENFKADGYQIYSSRFHRQSFRWMSLVVKFLVHHKEHHYRLMYAFWGYPAGFPVVFLGKLFGITSIVNLLGGDAAGVPSIQYGVFVKRLPSLIAKWTYKRATILLALSHYQVKSLENEGIKRSIRVIPFGSDPLLFVYTPPQIKSNRIRFIHVANLSPVKDQETLLKAFALISQQIEATLMIVGQDHLNGSLQQLCIDLHIDHLVTFLGSIPYEQIPALYKKADIMLHTSLSEGQCSAVTEAAMCGVLVAGTRVGMIHDLQEGTVNVNIRDYEGLANEVLSTIRDSEKWLEKVSVAREWGHRYTLNFTIDSLRKIFNDV
jgi:glycosyltransferase involved in cell wall biosynthesis